MKHRRHLQLAALIVAGEAVFALPFVLPRVFRPTLLKELEISNTELGYAFSVYGVVAMASYLLGGPLADRFSVRRMMAVALWATAAGGLWLATSPSYAGLVVLYGVWGCTTILLFWSGMLRATREWGGEDLQGRAYGLLDGGRGLFAAVLSSLGVFVLSSSSTGDGPTSLRHVIALYSSVTALAGVGVWFLVPEPTVALPKFAWSRFAETARRPTLWLHALIIVCAYVGYKGTDDLSLLAADALDYDDVQAAKVGTLAFWIRPVAAVAAGWFADRCGGWKTMAVCFALLIAADLVVISGAQGASVAVLFSGIIGTCIAVYALRGVYFALLAEARVPLGATGTAVGLVSLIGYTPDVFFGPMMGAILDSDPGVGGHQSLFGVLAVFAAVGLVATLLFGRRLAEPT